MSHFLPTYLLLILYTLTFLVSYKITTYPFVKSCILSTNTIIQAAKDRATESIPLASKDDIMVFGGLRLHNQVASSLRTMNILQPTAIQSTSLVPIANNISCIIHASTGTGKTLCYLLPLLNRIYAMDIRQRVPFCALIIVPSRELAIQVASDVSSLTNGDDALVHLCLSSSHAGFKDIVAPIIIGTSYKLLDTLRATDPKVALQLLKQTKYLVLDEVDRLVGVLGKYATYEDKKFSSEFSNPSVDLIGILVKIKHRQMMTTRSKSNADGTSSILDSQLQVVASSATIGRPLRRELYRLFHNPDTAADAVDKDKENRPAQLTGQFTVIRASQQGSSDDGEVTMSRIVGIPSTIRHVAVLDSKESDNLSGKLALLKDKWVQHQEMKRAILFVPTGDDVVQVVNILKFWGLTDEVVDLQAFLSAKKYNDDGREIDSTIDDGERSMSINGVSSSGKQQPRSRSTSELLASARQAKIGSISRQTRSTISTSTTSTSNSSSDNDDNDDDNINKTKRLLSKTRVKALRPALSLEDILDDAVFDNKVQTGRPAASTHSSVDPSAVDPSTAQIRGLYVISLAGSRGLHLQDVECVMMLTPPRTMDEYLHAAGRTGRVGNTVSASVVYTVATLDELKRLQSWQTPLGIAYDVIYS